MLLSINPWLEYSYQGQLIDSLGGDMMKKSTNDRETLLHFRSDLIFEIGTKGFPKYRKVPSKNPFMDELKARNRAGLTRQFEKLRPTVRSV